MKGKIDFARKTLRLLYEIAIWELCVCAFHIVFLKNQSPNFTYYVVFSLFVISYFIRNKFYMYGMIVVLHILLIIATALVPLSTASKGVLIFLEIKLMGDAVRFGNRGNREIVTDEFPWYVFVFTFIVYLYGLGADSELLKEAAVIVSIVVIILYYIMKYVDGLADYIDATKDLSGLPLERIYKVNSILVLMVLSAMLIAIIAGGMLDLSEIVRFIGNLIAYVVGLVGYGLKLIFKFVFVLFAVDKEQNAGVSANSNPPQNDYFKENSSGIVNMIFFVMFICVVAYVFYVVTRKIIKKLMSYRTFETDVVEKIEPTKSVACTKEKIKKDKRRSLKDEDKIREYYRTRILREKNRIDIDYKTTCREISTRIKELELGDVDELTDIYASVRYGNVKPDKDMIRNAGKLSRR